MSEKRKVESDDNKYFEISRIPRKYNMWIQEFGKRKRMEVWVSLKKETSKTGAHTAPLSAATRNRSAVAWATPLGSAYADVPPVWLDCLCVLDLLRPSPLWPAGESCQFLGWVFFLEIFPMILPS